MSCVWFILEQVVSGRSDKQQTNKGGKFVLSGKKPADDPVLQKK